MKTNIINYPDLKKAASRLKGETTFVSASFDRKDDLSKLLKGKNYYIRTYGCQANVRDEETMRGMLEDLGMVSTEDPKSADVIIINTWF